MRYAVLTSGERACGKLPIKRLRSGSYSSDNRPKSLRSDNRRSNNSRALPWRANQEQIAATQKLQGRNTPSPGAVRLPSGARYARAFYHRGGSAPPDGRRAGQALRQWGRIGGTDLGIKTVTTDFIMNLAARGAPVIERAIQFKLLDSLDPAIERNPCHDLGICEAGRSPRTSQMPASGLLPDRF